MLENGAAIVGILTFVGAVGGILFKIVRWGLRQDLAILALEKADAVKAAKLLELEQRLQQEELKRRELEWQGRVFVFPQGRQRRRERLEEVARAAEEIED